MAGRTHGPQVLPITFGYKLAVWVNEVDRHLEGCAEAVSMGPLHHGHGHMPDPRRDPTRAPAPVAPDVWAGVSTGIQRTRPCRRRAGSSMLGPEQQEAAGMVAVRPSRRVVYAVAPVETLSLRQAGTFDLQGPEERASC